MVTWKNYLRQIASSMYYNNITPSLFLLIFYAIYIFSLPTNKSYQTTTSVLINYYMSVIVFRGVSRTPQHLRPNSFQYQSTVNQLLMISQNYLKY